MPKTSEASARIKREVNIPFSGFYDSLYSAIIDGWVEQTAEHYCGEQADGLPEDLKLEEADFAEALTDAMTYSIACRNIARSYADVFNREVSEVIGFDLRLQFGDMTSPRFYNFETDKIFCAIPRATVAKLFQRSRADGHSTLEKVIARRHTSRDGFCSFYRSDLESWLEKGWQNWDHNELGTLLRAVMELSGWDRDDELDRLYYGVDDDGCFGEIDSAMDWGKYESIITAKRTEKETDFAAENPDYVPPPPRCEFTPDLFTGKLG